MLFAVAGCENDIDLKADDTTGLLCINGSLVAGAEYNYINVSVTGKDSPKGVTNAKVVVSVNGSVVETIDGVKRDDMYLAGDNWDYNFYKISASFNPGDYVQVDVYYGNQHAYGGGTVPQPVSKGSVQVGFKENVPYKNNMWSTSYDYSDMTTMATTMADPNPGQKNYFRMEVSQSDSVKYRVDERGHFLNNYGWHLSGADSESKISGYIENGHYDQYSKRRFYFDNDPILSAEVVKSQGDITFVDAVDNVYKIFNDNFFDGTSATINVMATTYMRSSFSEYMPSKYYFDEDYWGDNSYAYDEEIDDFVEVDGDYWKPLHDIDYYAPRYTHRNYVDIYSISEDEYYYLKVLNARGPDSYFEWDDSFSLTGDVKLPSNVKGGTGNIFVSSCARIVGSLYEDAVPEFGGDPENKYVF